MAEQTELVDRFLKALEERDLDAVVGFYAEGAQVVRFEGVAAGTDQIRAFFVGFFAAYLRFELVSLDQIRATDDLVVWDATMETGAGLLQVTNVLFLDDGGKIVRHVPWIRGYWGKT